MIYIDFYRFTGNVKEVVKHSEIEQYVDRLLKLFWLYGFSDIFIYIDLYRFLWMN